VYIYTFIILHCLRTLWHYIMSYGTKTTAQWTTFSFTTLVSWPGGCDGVTKYIHMTPRAQLLLFPNPFPSIAVRPPHRAVLQTDNIIRVHIIIMYDNNITLYTMGPSRIWSRNALCTCSRYLPVENYSGRRRPNRLDFRRGTTF